MNYYFQRCSLMATPKALVYFICVSFFNTYHVSTMLTKQIVTLKRCWQMITQRLHFYALIVLFVCMQNMGVTTVCGFQGCSFSPFSMYIFHFFSAYLFDWSSILLSFSMFLLSNKIALNS